MVELVYLCAGLHLVGGGIQYRVALPLGVAHPEQAVQPSLVVDPVCRVDSGQTYF